MSYPEGMHKWLSDIYGCENHGPTAQEIGSVLCREGRLLTFPNTLQYRVEPFSLKELSKRGHRKMLALFLIDPNIKIISTAHVPPQREDWKPKIYHKALPEGIPNQDGFKADGNLPISMDEAKQIRLKLMEERTSQIEQRRAFDRHGFNLLVLIGKIPFCLYGASQ